MSAIRVFEPALCCSTGVCGTDVDQKLVDFGADLNHVKSLGGDVTRFNLASDPQAFAENPMVVHFLQAAGSDGLPLVLADGVTVMAGRYPTRDELLRFAGVQVRPLEVVSATSSCCGGGTSCC